MTKSVGKSITGHMSHSAALDLQGSIYQAEAGDYPEHVEVKVVFLSRTRAMVVVHDLYHQTFWTVGSIQDFQELMQFGMWNDPSAEDEYNEGG